MGGKWKSKDRRLCRHGDAVVASLNVSEDGGEDDWEEDWEATARVWDFNLALDRINLEGLAGWLWGRFLSCYLVLLSSDEIKANKPKQGHTNSVSMMCF